MRISVPTNQPTDQGLRICREHQALALAIATSYGSALPKKIKLHNEAKLQGESIMLTLVIPTTPLGRDQATTGFVDRALAEELSLCLQRRLDANNTGLAIPELKRDQKLLALNKALHDAGAAGIRAMIEMQDGSEQSLKSVPPTDVRLIESEPEPQLITGKFLVSGFNVVGGARQLELFSQTKVQVKYFVVDAQVSEIRATVPLSLTTIVSMRTYIEGNFSRSAPDDHHAEAIGLPLLDVGNLEDDPGE
ncbi:hypothetical protein [Solilutibacter tolerans]|uniref:Uncharacterized protein n=1 Tax=Solilutibacter tolerans TaxID=1604334 RepID=A0A1N6S067_9GAMM|nr:hypothetical protein [Lysobacter tolerans]SIQ34437.1 hypothetical protein SAMN05421546_1144 [Lysobacter tolerans]